MEVHWIRAGVDGEVALTRVPPSAADAHGTPVVLVHGNFSDRGFRVSPRGIGLAPFLAGRGYDVWVPELRGHGRSPKGPGFANIAAEDHIKADLPAAVRYVRGVTDRPLFLAGHSAGGVFVACALAAAAVDRDGVLGAALFGAQISKGEAYLKIPPVAWLASTLLRLMGQLPAPRLGLGPEPEPAAEMIEFIRWKRLGGRWADRDGFDYGEGLARVATPVLSVAAAKDTNDPPEGCRGLCEAFGSPDKTFVLLGRESGHLKDYDHIGMIVSKEAAREVWPLLADWMDERRTG